MLRLQQIMFYRELELPLAKIGAVLDDPAFAIRRALHDHRAALLEREKKTQRLLHTIARTLRRLARKGETDMNEEEILALYEGFSREEALAMHREAEQRWGGSEAWAESLKKTQGMSQGKFKAINLAADAAMRRMAALPDRPAADPEIQKLVDAHYRWLLNFWTPDRNSYKGLGQMYAADPRFLAFYDRYRKDFADYLAAAITYYADHVLARGQ